MFTMIETALPVSLNYMSKLSRSHESPTNLHPETRSFTHSTVFWTEGYVSPYSHSGSKRDSLFRSRFEVQYVYHALLCWAAREKLMSQTYRSVCLRVSGNSRVRRRSTVLHNHDGEKLTTLGDSTHAPTAFEQTQKGPAG